MRIKALQKYKKCGRQKRIRGTMQNFFQSLPPIKKKQGRNRVPAPQIISVEVTISPRR